ncbi:MAG TPA: peptide chain release factor N(5)-glutamine methyltransferase [Polyangiaceae bacterium]|nr:MAG: Release factor glutamine methyltransferase [Deltaproteobacteria bacterium ADurb.Bin207]HOT12027.1 peptide chain release factor N(5)-glutamine methyltransferase [Polyangiaceae bacterium]HPB95099.1 peptide chain release factor N(5)-glutamine methyltransferase [Polyangiaceae bacterium]HQM08940.1 peptide chain release factor N(5)-glutamine methyltransferase [Polyangiaceae bacterium]
MTSQDSPATVSPRTEPWTVRRVLAWVTEDFASRGVETPRLEAELLLAHVLGANRIQLIVDRDRPLTAHELGAYRALVTRRRNHEPVAYLRKEREFYGHDFEVDARVLIPRPDTETLVEVALKRSQERYLFGRLLDVCTGSGNVALSFAKERPTWQVLATDLSSDAIAVASRNAVRLGVAWNVSFFAGDLFDPVKGQPRFHLITANPPYIPSEQVDQLSPSIRNHEPRLALDGGQDGLDLIRRLIHDAPSWLEQGGELALEMACDQGSRVVEMMTRNGWQDVQIVRDLGQRDRVVRGIRP